MGREVKRVPLDFDWPMGKIWPGYLGSHCGNMEYITGDISKQCRLCNLYRKNIGEKYRLEGEGNCPDYKTPPPAGTGFQMWETTSEGSPISPVFETPEKLAKWLADSGASSFGSYTASYEEWLIMIQGPNWAPSMVIDSSGMKSGVEACSEEEDFDD